MDANTPTAFSPQTQSRGKPSRLVLAVAAVLAAVLLGLFFGSVGHSQTPDNEGPILLAVGGPGCEAHPDEAVPSPGPPHPRISGLERCISPGSSDGFTLGAHNLVSSGQYSI